MKPLRILMHIFKGPVIGFSISILACTLLLFFLGEKPTLLIEAFQNTYFTSFGLGYTLFYTTPLIFTGLSVAIAAQCGLFNIGAEGQLYISSLCIITAAIFFPALSPVFAFLICLIAGLLGGGLWGGVAGFLKAKRGSHEVIVTILLNFTAYAITDYGILYLINNPEVQNPETLPIASNFNLSTLHSFFLPYGIEIFKSTPVNITLFLGLLTSIITYLFLFKTPRGYELRAVGQNPIASRFSGISVSRSQITAFIISGALTFGVGINEILGYEHKLTQGYSAQYGFTGIAVALLSKNHPIGILFSAFLFGSLHNVSRELEFLSDKVSKELSMVLEATLIAFVAGSYFFEQFLKRKKK